MIDAVPERGRISHAIGFEQGTAFSATFAARVLEQALEAADLPEARALVLNNLSGFLFRLGRHDEARAAASEAAELYSAPRRGPS